MRQRAMKRCLWLLILSIVASLCSGIFFQKASAQGAYDGYVYITVEKVTLGQGIIMKPMKAGYRNGDSAADVVLNAVGTANVGIVNGYLKYVTDSGEPQGWTTANIPAEIKNAVGGTGKFSARQNQNRLEELDYTNTSGWMYSVNDVMPEVSIDSYRLGESNDGDVIRLQFTVYGYGADLIGSNRLSTESLCAGFPEKLGLIRSMAAHDSNQSSVQYQNALAVMSDWNATADEIQNAVTGLENVDYTSDIYVDAHNRVIDYIHKKVTEPGSYSIGGEWAVLSLARSGVKDIKWYKCYYNQIAGLLADRQSNILHTTKSTENSRAIIALTAIGADPANISGYNLLKPLSDYEYINKQGINGYIYALIAMDCGNYNVSDTDIRATRNNLVEAIRNRKLETGGWSLSGGAADADITAMVIQALAPYYDSDNNVKADINEALEVLSNMQKEHGEFANTYIESGNSTKEMPSCESCAQVLCALSALGIDAEKDTRFLKNGSSVLDALLSFYDDRTGAFKHVINGETDQMATEQAAYALTAYRRMKEKKNGLYQMSDVMNLYRCLAHKWNHGVIIESPTLSKAGKTQYTCTVCGETKIQSIPKLTTTEQKKETTTEQTVSLKKPGKTSLRKVKSPKKKQIKVTWKKKSGVTGYQLQISTSSKFKKSKTRTYKITKSKTTSKTIKSLKSKKKYYVRIRTYKTAKINGKTITKYSSWSAKKAVKVK